MPFLTDVDSRAEVKGSRDPLGVVPIWSRFGREVVGNLTTVTNSVRGFTTLLLGLYFAEEVQSREGEDAASMLDLFLKFEQMAGYARVRHNGDRAVRGLRRINARLEERKRISISALPSDQILSNQKVYGLWGLFSIPSRSSELLVPHAQQLTPAARAYVEKRYLPVLSKAGGARKVVDLLRKESFTFDVESDLATALAKCHGRLSDDERKFYRHHLVHGGDVDSTNGRQPQLAALLEQHKESAEFGFDEFDKVVARARKSGLNPLVVALERIGALEHLLMPARVVFGFLLTRNDQPVETLARQVAKEWKTPPKVDLERLESCRDLLIAAAGTQAANGWMDIGRLIASADYSALIRALVDMNTRVMQGRNGSGAWLAIEAGRIRVRMADETEELLPARTVERLWRSTYFINSLWQITREVS